MVTFAIELADVCLGVSALYGQTREFCRDYLSNAEPEFHICLDEEDIEAERAQAARQDERAGLVPREWSSEYLETLALYRKAAAALLPYGTAVFHGAVVGAGGCAYCFTAPSGTGKTTHVRYWLSQVPGAFVLNGDKPLVRVTDGGVVVFGTPWRGKENMGVRGCLPLAGICALERGEIDEIQAMDAHEALPILIQQTYVPEGADAKLRIVELAGRITMQVPLWRMTASLNEASAQVSYVGMSHGERQPLSCAREDKGLGRI